MSLSLSQYVLPETLARLRAWAAGRLSSDLHTAHCIFQPPTPIPGGIQTKVSLLKPPYRPTCSPAALAATSTTANHSVFDRNLTPHTMDFHQPWLAQLPSLISSPPHLSLGPPPWTLALKALCFYLPPDISSPFRRLTWRDCSSSKLSCNPFFPFRQLLFPYCLVAASSDTTTSQISRIWIILLTPLAIIFPLFPPLSISFSLLNLQTMELLKYTNLYMKEIQSQKLRLYTPFEFYVYEPLNTELWWVKLASGKRICRRGWVCNDRCVKVVWAPFSTA